MHNHPDDALSRLYAAPSACEAWNQGMTLEELEDNE